MAITQDRVKALADAGLHFQRAAEAQQRLLEEVFLRARSDEQDWESALRELWELGQLRLLAPKASQYSAILAVEQERWRLNHKKNEQTARSAERKRRAQGAQPRQPEGRPSGQERQLRPTIGPASPLTEAERKEIAAVRRAFGEEAPGPDFEPNVDPFKPSTGEE